MVQLTLHFAELLHVHELNFCHWRLVRNMFGFVRHVLSSLLQHVLVALYLAL